MTGFLPYLLIILSAVFINNFVVVQFLGICPFLGVSKNTTSAFGMGVAVTFVMTLTCLITYPIYGLLVKWNVAYLEVIVFIFVIASLVQMLEMVLKRFSPTLYKSLGIYLPLITTNCAVLGVAELVITSTMVTNLLQAVLYGFFAGVGFTLAILIMSGIREKVTLLNVNRNLKGFPIAMLVACFMAMAFYVFGLIII